MSSCINTSGFKLPLQGKNVGALNSFDLDDYDLGLMESLINGDNGMYQSAYYRAINGGLRSSKGELGSSFWDRFDVSRFMKDGDHLAGLTTDKTLNDYIHNYNVVLASNGFTSKASMRHIISGMDGFFRESTKDFYSLRVFDSSMFGKFKDPKELIGRRFTDHGYTSTEIFPNYYEGKGGLVGFRGRNSRMKIYVPKGVPIVDGSYFENELVLGRGQTFSVLSAARSKIDNFAYDMEVAVQNSSFFKEDKRWNIRDVWRDPTQESSIAERNWFKEIAGWSESRIAKEFGKDFDPMDLGL